MESSSTHTSGIVPEQPAVVHLPDHIQEMVTSAAAPVSWPQGMAFIEYVRQVGERINREQDGKCRTREEVELNDRSQRVSRAKRDLIHDRGKRYENCRFETYEAKTAAQRDVVAKLEEYAKDSVAQIAAGTNVVLFGPRGTGKDHLLMALAHSCMYWSGCCVRWVNGVDLMEHFRLRAFDRPSNIERFMMGESVQDSDVLWISDPLPPSGPLSEFQQTELFKLIDKRYSDLKPTWVSLNATSAKDAEERMGAQAVDRLRHGALRLLCNWSSYREDQ